MPYAKRLQEWVQEKPEITRRELRTSLGQAIRLQTRRVWWQAERLGIHPRHLVFLDETGANPKRTRRYGRARRGQRVIGKVPHGHWKTTTFVAALRMMDSQLPGWWTAR